MQKAQVKNFARSKTIACKLISGSFNKKAKTEIIDRYIDNLIVFFDTKVSSVFLLSENNLISPHRAKIEVNNIPKEKPRIKKKE